MKVKIIQVKGSSDVKTLLSEIFKEIEASANGEIAAEIEPELNIGFFIDIIAEKKGWNPKKVESYLNSIDELYPQAAFSIILREIAVYLDSKYDNHIEKSDEIYVISALDGRIRKINKKKIKNYRNFAAFRTIEDAKTACNILRIPLKDMFKSDK